MFGKRCLKAIQFLGWLAIAVILAHAISMMTLDKRMEYKKAAFHSPRVPEGMNGYTIAFMTDTHALTAQALKAVVREVNAYQPDLLVLGGDFPASDVAPKRIMEILSKVNAKDGIYGVEGNHDNCGVLFAAMEENGMVPLSNNGRRVGERFYLAGVEDLWNRDPSIQKAVEGAGADDFVLLLSHNPDVTMVQDTMSVDLALCGHTHGGHVTFFGLWAPALAVRKSITGYGQRFMSGWAASRDGTPVYVSRGMGAFSTVPRVFARPQVVLITLWSGNE